LNPAGARASPEKGLTFMSRLRLGLLVAAVALAAAVVWLLLTRQPNELTLTGVVTTHDVVVSSQIGGQIGQLLVREGDQVTTGQKLAVIVPDALRADSAYYAHTAAGARSQVQESEAALRYQEQQTADQIRQAQASQASAEADLRQAQADLDNAKTVFSRNQGLLETGVISQQDLDSSRTSYEVAKAKVDALAKQVDVARAAVALVRSNAEQVAVRRSQLAASQQQRAAASAQQQKADVMLGYTDIRSPLDGLVDVRAARQGEVVTAGQPIVTIINPDDLWVRADVEETYIDRIRLGDRLAVRLPSGAVLQGAVFYKAADAGFATQRDVSRTKRDIKTFEIRLRVDNHDRRLAVGMTAYVTLPLGP
jgi:HlyD family secretion protein